MKTKVQAPTSLSCVAWLCCGVYFASYLARQDYNAALTAMCQDLALPKALLSLAGTAGFLSYGAGQLICGLWLRRVAAKKMLCWGLRLSAACNLLFALASTWRSAHLPWLLAVLWFANGFAQSMLWPALLQIMVTHCTPKEYHRGCVWVTVSSQVATMLCYVLVPLLIHQQVGAWRWLFVGSGLAALAFAALAARWLPTTVPSASVPQTASVPLRRLVWSYGLWPLLVAIALHGLLRDGVSTWLPLLVQEGYPQLRVEYSIGLAGLLPLVTAVSVHLAGRLQQKWQNERLCATVFMSLGLASGLGLRLGLGHSLWVNIACMAVLLGSMNGFNLMLVCQFPARFAAWGSTGTVAGLLNAVTYIGSAASMTGLAWVSDRFGWSRVVELWVGAAALGLAFCGVQLFVCKPPCQNKQTVL